MITLAGSGPSAFGWEYADIVTKKRPCKSDLIVYPKGHWVLDKHPPQRVIWTEYPYRNQWVKAYDTFLESIDVGKVKMSNGLQAICVAMDIHEPEEIGLIGYDSFLDGCKRVAHNWKAERAFAATLVKVTDLRQGS